MAVAGAVLQRDAPAPAGILRLGQRIGLGRPDILGLRGDGTVAEQIV